MDELRELAEADDTDVVLARESHGRYRLDGPPVQADDISPEGEFPKYGRYLPVMRLSPEGGQEKGPAWLECPRGLAEVLVDLDLDEEGADFLITQVSKSADGAWKFVVDGEPDE